MENNNTSVNFLNMMQNDNNLQPLVNLLNSVMGISESILNEESVQELKNMINESLNEETIEEAVINVSHQFRNERYSKKEVSTLVITLNKEFNEIILELKPSAYKKEILDFIASKIIRIFQEVEERYSIYDIKLPIKLSQGAQMPKYAHSTDACADVYASEDMTLPAHSLSNMVHTGIRIALPESWVMMIDPRSSIGLKSGLRLSNSIGIIDEDYRGEICILYDNISDSDYEIKAGDRIAQVWIQPVYRFKPVEVVELPSTDRGEGGFGSTGK